MMQNAQNHFCSFSGLFLVKSEFRTFKISANFGARQSEPANNAQKRANSQHSVIQRVGYFYSENRTIKPTKCKQIQG